MNGFRSKSQKPAAAGAQGAPADGIQRLKPPGSAPTPDKKAVHKPAPRQTQGRISSFLSDHWGKIAMGTAAAIVVGVPALSSHQQLSVEHPEFSAFSVPGVAQRAHRTAEHLGAMFDAAYYRTDPMMTQLKKTFRQSNGSAIAPYAVVCMDKELLARAKQGHNHAKAYLAQAEEDLAPQLKLLSQQDTPFYKTHINWDPNIPAPAAAFDVDYNKMWYPSVPADVQAPRPVSQWVVSRGTGICPTGKVPQQRALDFK